MDKSGIANEIAPPVQSRNGNINFTFRSNEVPNLEIQNSSGSVIQGTGLITFYIYFDNGYFTVTSFNSTNFWDAFDHFNSIVIAQSRKSSGVYGAILTDGRKILNTKRCFVDIYNNDI